MSIKEEVIKTINELPDDVTYEDIMEEIFV
ncbi:hypothetical protein HNR44_002978 [Geomicrobium halophilum]|uniref:Uncharacterized protein n=1 Tax=Geomicrobium halophilum TaxID=549000 RepID=A0A841Q2P1_9BACL|nr:hypothetical protein [Geomicrobium halophilum]